MFIKKENDLDGPQWDSKVRVQESGLNQGTSCDYIQRESGVQKLPTNLSDCFANNENTSIRNEDGGKNLLHYTENETSDKETLSCPKEIKNDLSGEEVQSCPQYMQNISGSEYLNSTKYSNQITVHVSSVVPEGSNVVSREVNKTEKCTNLNEQIKTEAVENMFVCGLCGKSFCTQFNLKIHMWAHTNEKTFKCEHCDKSFTRQKTLKDHIKTHTGERLFKCGHCDKSFCQKYSLKRHIMTHTGEKPFQCEECDQSFYDRSSLNKHIKTHTGEKPFKCGQCRKSFNHLSSLKNHLMIHTGETPFKCGQCSKSFYYPGSLKTHMKTHTGETPFKCGRCSKSFCYPSSLKTHMKTQHQGSPQCDAKVRVQDSSLNQDTSCDYIERGSDVQKLPTNLSDCLGTNQDSGSTCIGNEDGEENILHYMKKETSDEETVSFPKEIKNDLSEEEAKNCPQYVQTMANNEPLNSTEYANLVTVHISSVVTEGSNVESSELIKSETQ